MRLLDRYVLKHFLLAYAVCFASLVSLYVVIDLFAQIDEFTQHVDGPVEFFRNTALYYGYRIPWFFQRLSGLISVLAALFTLAWFERHNEVVPWLTAGVPGRRLLWPVVLGALGVIGLSLANRELLVPRCSDHLQRVPDDPFGERPALARGAYDANGIHLNGGATEPARRAIQIGHVTLPSHLMGSLVHLRCAEMVYRAPSPSMSGGWFLNGTKPEHFECSHAALNWLGPGTYFIHTDVSYEQLTRRADWFYYESTATLLMLVTQGEQMQRRGELIALVHRRLTTPLWELIVVLVSIAWLAGRHDRRLVLKLGGVLLLNVAVHSLQLLCLSLGQQAYLNPVLASWLPVLGVGPIAVALWDAMRT